MTYFKKNVTLYTDTKYKGILMKKVCNICSIPKLLTDFYKRHKDCIDCWNKIRRDRYKKSVCKHCKIEFRPGIEGRYRFCSEICRFISKIKIDVSGCWLWQAHIQKRRGGYGTFVPIGGRSGLAHRTSYRLFNGTLDENKLVMHSCHNPICVNPKHLSQGTPMDNTIDRKKAGRSNYKPKKGYYSGI